MIVFNESVRFLDTLPDLPSPDEIRATPQFLRADPDMVHRLGTPFLRRVLASAPLPRARHVTVDTKVHMLMRGWHACIPGWHCDDFHRPGGGQPDLAGIRAAWAEHALVVVGPTALPEFAVEPLTLPSPADLPVDGRPVYALYHERIEAARPRRARPASGQLVRFSCLDFHRGVPAEQPGWRLFVRVTASDHHVPWNEVRTQTQVYLTEPFEQW